MSSSPDGRGRSVLVAAVTVLVVVLLYKGGRRLLGLDRFTIERTRPVVSRVDGLRYRVHENHTGPDKAADALARINERLIGVMRYLRRRYSGRGLGAYPGFAQRRAATARLLARYNPDHLAENSPRDPSGDSSYCLNKGSVIALCLRERDPRASGDPLAYDLHDLDTLTFVALHELSHVAIDAVDHPKEFWETFRFLLESAEEAGIYTSADYALAPRVYCGVKVDYNPRMDPAIRPI